MKDGNILLIAGIVLGGLLLFHFATSKQTNARNVPQMFVPKSSYVNEEKTTFERDERGRIISITIHRKAEEA